VNRIQQSVPSNDTGDTVIIVVTGLIMNHTQILYSPLSGTTRMSWNIHPLTPILVINHPLSASFIHCNP